MSEYLEGLMYLRDREIELLREENERMRNEKEIEKIRTAVYADRPPPQMPHPTFEPRKADYNEIPKAK
jgi:hypothetical protein